MARQARIFLAAEQPDGVTVAEVVSPDGRLYAELEPDADARVSGLLDDFARLADESAGPVVLDMRPIVVVDSSGCALLMRLRKVLLDRNRVLVLCTSPQARDVFEVTKLVRLIPCHTDPDAAVALARADAKA
ncbi:MAG TPA: STAS domain-containing protein [Gemmataceae bacterium]|nr:STAS domain-containing protein [Gemmataceae bacterium]